MFSLELCSPRPVHRLAGFLVLGLVVGLVQTPSSARAQDDSAGTVQPAEAESHSPAATDTHATTSEHEAEAAHGGGGEPNILEFQPPLAFWTLLVFLLLLGVLWKFAWGPLSKALDEREHAMERTLQAAEHARAESEKMLAEHRQLMAKANEDAQSILDEARKAATSSAEEIRRVAQSEADSTMTRAQREIASAKDQALLEIWNKTADLAVGLSEKVLSREMNDDDHKRLIDAAMAELPNMAPSHTGQGHSS